MPQNRSFIICQSTTASHWLVNSSHARWNCSLNMTYITETCVSTQRGQPSLLDPVRFATSSTMLRILCIQRKISIFSQGCLLNLLFWWFHLSDCYPVRSLLKKHSLHCKLLTPTSLLESKHQSKLANDCVSPLSPHLADSGNRLSCVMGQRSRLVIINPLFFLAVGAFFRLRTAMESSLKINQLKRTEMRPGFVLLEPSPFAGPWIHRHPLVDALVVHGPQVKNDCSRLSVWRGLLKNLFFFNTVVGQGAREAG